MQRRRNDPWTSKDDDLLKAFVAKGGSALRAASIFSQSVRQIRARAAKLGTPFPSVRETRRMLAAISSIKLRQPPPKDLKDEALRTEQARQVAAEYADDQHAILRRLSKQVD